jgi:hypothetical protein
MMMHKRVLRSFVVGLLVVAGMGLGVWAQTASLTVTAYSDAVRFSAQGSVKELRVEVLSLSGQKVFDSGPVLSNALDWKLLNTQGQPIANGVYLYTVTIKDPFGNVTRKLGKLAVLRGKGVAAPPLSGITVGEMAEEKFRLAPQAYDATNWFVQNSLGVGTDTPASPLHVRATFTGTAANYGQQLLINFNPAGPVSATQAALSVSANVSSGNGQSFGSLFGGFLNVEHFGSGTISSAFGFQGKVNNRSSGTITTARGIYAVVQNLSTGTITTGAGVWIDPPLNSGGGTFTNYYGVRIADPGTAASNAFAVYVLGGKSYFGGNVGIGATSPGYPLTVVGVIHSTTGGFRFPDGTTQTTAAAPGTSGWTDDGATVRLTTAGDNVGIGTSTTSAKTHISNTANQPGLRIDSSDGTNALEIYNTGSGSATGLIFRVERATGNVYADGSITGGGADVAERIDVSEAVAPGDVVEIDPDNPGKFRKAREALSTRVAGVISTAPGVVLGNEKQLDGGIDARPILALAGRVPVKVTAKFGAISIGDLLVSSPIPGYAMKCPEASQCIGAVIGKALEPLKEGVGLIEAQVMLR